MCGLLFHQIRARCPREPSGAGSFCCCPHWACLPQCSWVRSRDTWMRLSVFLQACSESFSHHSRWLEYISLSVCILKIWTELQIFTTWVLANSNPVQSFFACFEHSWNTKLIQRGEIGEWEQYLLHGPFPFGPGNPPVGSTAENSFA